MPNMWTRWLIACLSLAGCGAGSASEAEQARTMDSAGVVDSAFTPEEQFRRFTEGLEVPAELAGGSASREALVRRYVDALQSHDTSAIRDMTLSRAEFAYLHYPGSPYARPPMRGSGAGVVPDPAKQRKGNCSCFAEIWRRGAWLPFAPVRPRSRGAERCPHVDRLRRRGKVWRAGHDCIPPLRDNHGAKGSVEVCVIRKPTLT
jgi:hypothetical protein